MSSFADRLVELIPHLRAYARSLTAGDVSAADDLVQDALVKALGAQDQFTSLNLKAWAFTILRNVFISSKRRQRVRNEVSDEGLDATMYVAPGQERRLEARAFERAFARLSANHREVLILIGVHGYNYEDAAQICGCEVGTIKSRVNRARAHLKRMLLDGQLPVDPKPVDRERVLHAIDWSCFAVGPEGAVPTPRASAEAPALH
jgi:RNA polymerase sigma-70 factor (ECF subfamily)